MENVLIRTADGVEISANWADAGADALSILLLHMMPATKESWIPFQEELLKAGLSSLATDFRGHGASVKGPRGNLDYKIFSDGQHREKIRDVEAAISWLEKKNGENNCRAVAGASIGANLALQYGAEHPEKIMAVVALSPGLNYRGIKTMPLVTALERKQALFLVASDDDAESADAARKLADISLAKTEIKIFKSAGHGTRIFESEPQFMNEVILWMEFAIKN